MSIEEKYLKDYEEILSHRHDNGGDYFTTPDFRLIKGSPFSTLESISYLLEIGMDKDDQFLQECANLIFSTWKENGSFKLYPYGSIYPCHTINAVSTLCQMGYAKDSRVVKTFEHLLKTQCSDGGWRCKKFSFGRGPETEFSNPLPTLNALNAMRYSNYAKNEIFINNAVDFLLNHWVIKKPIGPCHYGIGSLFMSLEYPFRNYNLFNYVYILSFFDYAIDDKRFSEAFKALESKLVNGKIIVERVVPKLAKLSFCRKGEPSELATIRFNEILKNLGK